MKWYEIKEQAAGTKRLFVMFFIHKIFGKNAVKFITFFITLFVFTGAKEIRSYSKKYLVKVGLKPSLINIFRHFLNYSYTLIDRMEIFSGKFPPEKITFADNKDREQWLSDLKRKKGVFFICNHVGNIDVMRVFMSTNIKDTCNGVYVFMSKDQCKIFNGFLNKIANDVPMYPYPIEDININTSIEMKDKLNKGGIIYMAGDRVSAGSLNFEAKFLNSTVEFPLGVFKFAQIMEVPIYFISAIKEKNDRYKIYLQKFYNEDKKAASLEKMKSEFIEFLETMTKLAPLQFYHFYDLFKD